jgi:preprotein translocase subunit SecA
MRVIVDVEKAAKNEGREVARALERTAILSTIDDKWMEHLRELDTVKEGIGLRSFGQKDPLLEYKKEAFEMFKDLLDNINQDAISLIWKAIPEIQADPAKVKQAQKQKAKVDIDKANPACGLHEYGFSGEVSRRMEAGSREHQLRAKNVSR